MGDLRGFKGIAFAFSGFSGFSGCSGAFAPSDCIPVVDEYLVDWAGGHPFSITREDDVFVNVGTAKSLMGINEAGLRSLVANGDLRAYRREGATMFRYGDVRHAMGLEE